MGAPVHLDYTLSLVRGRRPRAASVELGSSPSFTAAVSRRDARWSSKGPLTGSFEVVPRSAGRIPVRLVVAAGAARRSVDTVIVAEAAPDDERALLVVGLVAVAIALLAGLIVRRRVKR